MAAGRKERLDKVLVDRGLVASRERAQRLVMAGAVFAGDLRLDKPGMKVAVDGPLEVRGQDHPFVSRGGVKLAGALDAVRFDVRGLVCLDVGASTGGFTDCLLQRGAARVYAVDVGYGQLAWQLREDARVVNLERTNARTLGADRFPEALDLATVDVSFISLRLVLPAVVPLIRPGGALVTLVKPQFEVGKGRVGAGGVVRDPMLHAEVLARTQQVCSELGLAVDAVLTSSLIGPAGNREFFLVLRVPGGDRQGTPGAPEDDSVDGV